MTSTETAPEISGVATRVRPALKAIVLAAGKGGVTADGSSMLLQTLGDRTVLDCVMENALAVVPADSIYVVVGYRQEEVRARLGENYTLHQPGGAARDRPCRASGGGRAARL